MLFFPYFVELFGKKERAKFLLLHATCDKVILMYFRSCLVPLVLPANCPQSSLSFFKLVGKLTRRSDTRAVAHSSKALECEYTYMRLTIFDRF